MGEVMSHSGGHFFRGIDSSSQVTIVANKSLQINTHNETVVAGATTREVTVDCNGFLKCMILMKSRGKCTVSISPLLLNGEVGARYTTTAENTSITTKFELGGANKFVISAKDTSNAENTIYIDVCLQAT